jgi:ferrous iron transport protein B
VRKPTARVSLEMETRGEQPSREQSEPVVALLGNPNTGKSTLFNRLTGLSQKIGNYPGVTVEKKEGTLHLVSGTALLVDLPGTYSLAAQSPDERVTLEVLLGRQPGEPAPDLVLHVVDACQLERNLYLLSHLSDLGLRTILVLNMSDAAQARGLAVDPALLTKRLGIPVVATQAHRGTGLDELRDVVENELARSTRRTLPNSCEPFASLPQALREQVAELHTSCREASGEAIHEFEVLRALVDEGRPSERRLVDRLGEDFDRRLKQSRQTLAKVGSLPATESQARYSWIRERLGPSAPKAPERAPSFSERIDHVLTHRILGPLIFAAIMIVVFQAIFTGAQPLMNGIDAAFGTMQGWLTTALPVGHLRSLLVDGIVGGVGSVVIFLPQILILFFFIGLLEDSGYMARAAFIMDRLMVKCGLSGKSFIPMLSGFACAVPAIMATRVIEDRRNRLTTILVTPLMTCSARLPVYTILIGTFVPDSTLLGGLVGVQALTLFGLYLLGVVAAVAIAWVLRGTLLKGPTPPFLLELPSYKRPSLRSLALRLYDRTKAFIRRAGTIILAISIVVWALAYFPRSATVAADYEAEKERIEVTLASLPEGDGARDALEEELAALGYESAGAQLRQSALGRLGRGVEPVFRPLGWDWKISMAVIASFPAREVVVATLGTIYNLGEETDVESTSLRSRLREARWENTERKVFSLPVALSLMVFFALCCQCGATIATIKRETDSWGWAWFGFGYMTALAYVGAYLTYIVSGSILGA